MRRAHCTLYRGEKFVGAVRARSHHVENLRGRAVLLRAARPEPGRGGRPCRQRFRQGRAAAIADGVRGRGTEADLDLARGKCRVMVEPDNIVPEHLRAIRGDMGKLVDEMQTMRAEMTAMRQFMAGMMTIQEHDHVDLAGIKLRLDRIEKRLELAN